VRLVVGTRPEAIKLAPVAHALAERGIVPTLVYTGQHAGLEPSAFGLGGYAGLKLDCPGEEDPHAHVRKVTAALLPHFWQPPDLLIVQGDTSSALGATLAGFTARVPVAHVEAGLRTHDPRSPWPEEEYRVAIDAGADLLFAPTEIAATNLEGEQVPGEIHVTGNTGVDALLRVERELPPRRLADSAKPQVLVTCHRRESWGEGLRSIATALRKLARDHAAQIHFVLHPNAHVAARMREQLQGVENIALHETCGHLELVRRMREADLILSDSGGMQEEAPALGVPLLVLREKTERPEGLATGNLRLVGTSADRIVAEARRLLADPIALAAMSHRALPYGDGKAGPRIAEVIEAWLERRSKSRQVQPQSIRI
jgi:UDP-N-acetylglucosamine 2-epimerase (non-hydrolysing)